MASRLVESTSVERTSFHIARPRWAHTYAVPYLAVYVVILAIAAWAKYGVTAPDTALGVTPTTAATTGDVDAAVFLALNASSDVDASDAVALDVGALANDSVVVADSLLDGVAEGDSSHDTPGAEAAAQEPATALPARREPKRVLDDDEEPWDPNADVPAPMPSTAPAPPPTPVAEPTPEPEPVSTPKVEASASSEPTPNRAAWTVDEATIFALVLAAIGQAVAFLACHWSVNVRAAFTCSTVTDPFKAEFIKVMPAEHRGVGELCTLQRNPDVRDAKGRPQLWFSFQRRKFEYDADERKQFRRVRYPVGFPLQHYQSSMGYPTTADLQHANKRWGANSLNIPLPTFLELYKEHAVAPFFVFQVFCVGLWCLDEYWYYSIFTLFMLVLFESTIVFQRVRNMTELRKMAPQPYSVNVFRVGAWVQIPSSDLLPGDLCSIVRSEDDRAVPCDLVLVQGSAIVNEAMLTGESTPQLKESIADREPDATLDIVVKDKNHMLFAGTKVVQSSLPATLPGRLTSPPDGGAVAYVLRTGFDTSQGKLVRTILFSTERITANNLESLFFILFLLMFAIAAAAYVWIRGNAIGRRRWSLVLDCILIITSVVPPDLPMQLALAVNQSLLALQKTLIFCTEPFRIPYAGKIDVCCFDKTGTLTSEELVVQGVAGTSPESPLEVIAPKSTPTATVRVLAVCHSLLLIDDGSVVGDPMEKATLAAIGWNYNRGNVVKSPDGRKTLRILRRFAFSSQLKRMSVVSMVESPDAGEAGLFVAVKGAPETLAPMLVNKPDFYDQTHKTIAAEGSRVIALAYKWMPDASQNQVKGLAREDVESGLVFAGFLAFHCPVKPDSKASVELLLESSHRVIMITGDNALTACHVAREVSIVRRKVLILDGPGDENHPTAFADLRWTTVDESPPLAVTTDRAAFEKVLYSKDACFTGRALMAVAAQFPQELGRLLAHVRVFARTSPQEKELILTALKKVGYVTLMCGDGTNDVGALKQAHVGVALLDGRPEDIPKFMERMKLASLQKRAKAQRRQRELTAQANQLQQTMASADTPAARKVQAAQRRDALLQAAKEALAEIDDDMPTVKLGDASIAAPFTSKISYVTSIVNIVRQGRSALVTTMQMYKILALSCLISAFCLSVLYLDGIKYGDTQMTIQGVLLTVCFLGLANAKPAENLSKQRPQPNIFNFYILLSVIGQFAVHVIALVQVSALAKSFMPEPEVVDLERKFEASLLNSGVYLISLSMHVSTFMVNYQGRPFRESMYENKPMFYTLSAVMGICVFAASDTSEEFRVWLELVPFPLEYRDRLIGLIAFDFFGSFAVEIVTNWLFANNRPDPRLRLD